MGKNKKHRNIGGNVIPPVRSSRGITLVGQASPMSRVGAMQLPSNNQNSTPASTPSVNPRSTYVPKSLPWQGPAELKEDELEGGTLYLSGLAYTKLCYWRDIQDKEVSCWGLIHKEHPFVVTDMILVHQKVSGAYTEMQEDHMGFLMEYFKTKGINPGDWLVYWFHTHPKGMGPNPSGQDNTTFESDRQAKANVSIMAILSKKGEFSCRVRMICNGGPFNTSPRAIHITQEFKVAVLPSMVPDAPMNPQEWKEEFKALVEDQVYSYSSPSRGPNGQFYSSSGHHNRDEFYRGNNFSGFGYNGNHYVKTMRVWEAGEDIPKLAAIAEEKCINGLQLDLSPAQTNAVVDCVKEGKNIPQALMVFRHSMPADRNSICNSLRGVTVPENGRLRQLIDRILSAHKAYSEDSNENKFAATLFESYEMNDNQRVRATNLLGPNGNTDSDPPARDTLPDRVINGKILPIGITLEAAVAYADTLGAGYSKDKAVEEMISKNIIKQFTESELAQLDEWRNEYEKEYVIDDNQVDSSGLIVFGD